MRPWRSRSECGLNAGVVSSNSACVAMKTPLVRKVKGNHFTKSTSQELALLSSVSGSATLESEYAT